MESSPVDRVIAAGTFGEERLIVERANSQSP